MQQVRKEVRSYDDGDDHEAIIYLSLYFLYRFIPPHTFVPVALNINTTYIEIDYCAVTGYSESNPGVATYNCSIQTERLYGSQYLFPRSYDVAQTKNSTCKVDGMYVMTYPCEYGYIDECVYQCGINRWAVE